MAILKIEPIVPFKGPKRKDVVSFFYFCFMLLLIIVPCSSDILVMKKGSNRTIVIIGDLPAAFGPSLPLAGLQGYVVSVTPNDACVRPSPPPMFPNYSGPFIALVRRYNCTFVQKVLNAQMAGYRGVIVRNVGSNSVDTMEGDENSSRVMIPSVFVGQDDGILIEDRYQYSTGYYVVITDDLPFNIQNYLIPFAITIGICFVLMLSLMLVKCIRDYRRTRRYRLSSRALKKLPIHKFKKGDPYDCCAICLEDYADNDKLRILPCGHAYHSKCIDPWLTKNRRVCPVCKRKVITGDERASDFESDSEDETAPLINSGGGTQGGTFTQQRENPFEEAGRQAARRQQEEGGQRRGWYSRLPYVRDTDSEEEEVEEAVAQHQPSPSSQRSNLGKDSSAHLAEEEPSTLRNPGAEESASEPPAEASASIREQRSEVGVEGPSAKAPTSTATDCVV